MFTEIILAKYILNIYFEPPENWYTSVSLSACLLRTAMNEQVNWGIAFYRIQCSALMIWSLYYFLHILIHSQFSLPAVDLLGNVCMIWVMQYMFLFSRSKSDNWWLVIDIPVWPHSNQIKSITEIDWAWLSKTEMIAQLNNFITINYNSPWLFNIWDSTTFFSAIKSIFSLQGLRFRCFIFNDSIFLTYFPMEESLT